MKILFVTGSDAPFFNSLLVCLQAFSERMPGERLLVCDFGLVGAQAAFLRSIGGLLQRPPELKSCGVFRLKTALLSYLRQNGHSPGDYDAMVWLDADLTLMQVGLADFRSIIAVLVEAGADVAACREPSGRNVGQMLSVAANPAAMAPFARLVAEAAIDPRSLYLSTGLLFCRSASVLRRWQDVASTVADHPLFDQNLFNVLLHCDRIRFHALDCEEWQAQGSSLDRVRLVAAAGGGRPAAAIGDKNIKILHTTSAQPGHLLITNCRMTVRDLDLVGPFKLFLAEPLRLHQLQLLASFVAGHGEGLRRLGLCTPAARPAAGFEFATL